MPKPLHVWRALLIAAVALAFLAATVHAETAPGTFARLSPGDQKIARALFEAQTTSTTYGSTPLTLDQIAMKKQRAGWGEIFKAMKAQGLLSEKNLGEVVSRYDRRHPEIARKPDNAKPEKAAKPDKPDKLQIDRPEKPGR
jgi:hypothetical protein